MSNRVSRRQGRRWAAQEEQQYEQQPAPAPPPAPVPPQKDTLEQLKELGALHEQGVLTDAEFSAQKAKVLAG